MSSAGPFNEVLSSQSRGISTTKATSNSTVSCNSSDHRGARRAVIALGQAGVRVGGAEGCVFDRSPSG